jgi:RNA polymerase sigma factor (sigma-70 family)
MAPSNLDPAAYAALVHTAAAPAWRAARRVTCDGGLASDAVQEAFLRLVDGRTTLERLAVHGDRTQGLVALAVRVALDHQRSSARRRAREERRAMEHDRFEDSDSPGERLEQWEAEHALASALLTLPERLRLAVELRFREGLTFAAIGRALGSSESAAHDRVEAALASLRRRLRPEGLPVLAGLAGGLPQPVQRGQAGALGGPAPSANEALMRELVDGLLRLPSAVCGSMTTASTAGTVTSFVGLGRVVLLVCVALGALGIANAVLGSRGWTSPLVAATGFVAVNPGQDPAPASSARSAESDADRSTSPREPAVLGGVVQQGVSPFVLTGRVLDTQGHAVPGATVRASTAERSGKFPRWSGSVVAGADGSYRLVVPFGAAESRGTAPVGEGLVGLDRARLILEAGHLGYVLRTGVTVDAARGGAVGQDLTVALPPEERAGSYTLDVLLRDGTGAPVEGALVELTHVTPRDRASVGEGVPLSAWSSQGQWLHLAEGKGRSGPDGRVTLAGARLGPKSLWIEPRTGAAPMRTALAIHAEGAHARDLTLEVGHTLRGTFRWAGAGALAASEARALNVNVIVEPNRWRTVSIDTDGAFFVEALPAGAATLRVAPNYDWPEATGTQPSHVTLELSTGDAVHVLELKREDDPLDIGLHDAELHGVAVDAATGDPVPIAGFDLFTWRLAELPEGDLELDLRPNFIHAPPVQRMAGPGVARSSNAFHEVGLAAGPHMVQVTVRGRGTGLVGPIVLGSREVRAGLEVRVGPTASVDVTVVDAQGRPIEGAFVFVTGQGPHSDAVVAGADRDYRAIEGRGVFFRNGGRRTDGDGRAHLAGLPHGLRYTVAALHPLAASGRSRALTAQADGPLACTLALGPGR